jgi:MYXO-CTERM domain-containing protein
MLTYQGTWQDSVLPGHSGGAVEYTNDGTPPVGQATFTFTGTGVDYIAAKWFNRGIAAVSLDGGPSVDVDLYAPGTSGDTNTVAYKQVVYSKRNLSNGSHTLTVTYTGRFNPLADPVSSYLITIDAFDVFDDPPPVVSTSASSPWSIGLLALVAVGLVVVLERRRRAV